MSGMTDERRDEKMEMIYSLQEKNRECLEENDALKEENGWWNRLRPCVRTLARMMQVKLEANAHKDGPTDREFLMAKLVEEVAELLGNPSDWGEAADVANLAMILCCYDRGEPWYDEEGRC